MKLPHIAAAALVTASLGLASLGAQAVVVDISATSGATQAVTFAAGTYTVSWIDNTANGGYNGWTYQWGNPNVREAFDVSVNGHAFSVDVSNGGHSFTSYGTAALALTAANAGPYVAYFGTTDGSVAATFGNSLQFTLAAPSTLTFGIPDYELRDNTGGVSLAITAAVPEPGTYALMLAGLAAMGFVARRRQAR